MPGNRQYVAQGCLRPPPFPWSQLLQAALHVTWEATVMFPGLILLTSCLPNINRVEALEDIPCT